MQGADVHISIFISWSSGSPEQEHRELWRLCASSSWRFVFLLPLLFLFLLPRAVDVVVVVVGDSVLLVVWAGRIQGRRGGKEVRRSWKGGP